MTPNPAISVDALEAAVMSGRLPFAEYIIHDSKYLYESDHVQRLIEYGRINQVNDHVGIRTEAEFFAQLERFPWSRQYLARFGAASGYHRFRSDRSLLWLMILVASAADQLTVEDLVAFGWDRTFAERVLSIAQPFTAQACVH